jgi:hypothetical protein
VSGIRTKGLTQRIVSDAIKKISNFESCINCVFHVCGNRDHHPPWDVSHFDVALVIIEDLERIEADLFLVNPLALMLNLLGKRCDNDLSYCRICQSYDLVAFMLLFRVCMSLKWIFHQGHEKGSL